MGARAAGHVESCATLRSATRLNFGWSSGSTRRLHATVSPVIAMLGVRTQPLEHLVANPERVAPSRDAVCRRQSPGVPAAIGKDAGATPMQQRCKAIHVQSGHDCRRGRRQRGGMGSVIANIRCYVARGATASVRLGHGRSPWPPATTRSARYMHTQECRIGEVAGGYCFQKNGFAVTPPKVRQANVASPRDAA